MWYFDDLKSNPRQSLIDAVGSEFDDYRRLDVSGEKARRRRCCPRAETRAAVPFITGQYCAAQP